jgi:hypothetical protein
MEVRYVGLTVEHAISARCLANSTCAFSCFPHNFWNSYEYLIDYQSEQSLFN